MTILSGWVRKKLAFALLKIIIQYFVLFPKLIREIPLFWNSILLDLHEVEL